MISLKQLTYALAVDKTRHFKKAADQCAVSQSALSTAISELESQLGVQIFERDNKKVLVTTMGEQILAKAANIKLQVEDLYLLSGTSKAPLTHPMRLGVIPSIGPYLLPKVLPEVRQQYPNFKLSIVEQQSHILLDLIRSGEIDTAILALPYNVDGLHAFEFWQENFHLVTHKQDPVSTLSQVTSDEIDSSTLLLLKEGHCLKEHALAACKLKTTERDTSLSGTSLFTLVQMVAGKLGVTLVPEMALSPLVSENPELKSLPLNEPGPHRRIAFITRLNYAGVANIEVLITLFKSALNR